MWQYRKVTFPSYSAPVSSCILWAPIFWWTQSFGAYISIGSEISTSTLFLLYIMWRSNLPHTFAAYICRLYFESPPTFWASANILYMCEYFRQVPIFWWFFAISFAWFVAANICVYFQYLFMHFMCTNIFGAIVLKPRFKIDVQWARKVYAATLV